MASRTTLRYPTRLTSHSLLFRSIVRRSLTTSQRPTNPSNSSALIKPAFIQPKLQHSFRRSYADSLPVKAKRRGGGFFRWTWRVVYLSAIGGVGWLSYSIYQLRTPSEQFEPDPSKKTLVILGMSDWFQMVGSY